MTDRYEKLRAALAMNPTSGPWLEVHHEGSRWTDIYQDGGQRYATPIMYVPPLSVRNENGVWEENKNETAANVKYIVACDPDTIRELLAERDRLAITLRAEVAALREKVESTLRELQRSWK